MSKKQSRFDLILGAVDKFTGPFRAYNQMLAKNTEGVRKFNASVVKMRREMGFDKIAVRTQNLNTALSSMVGTVSRLTAGFTAFAAAAGGSMLAISSKTSDAALQIQKNALNAGIDQQTYQEYAYAAGQTGVSDTALTEAFLKLSESKMKAAMGDKTAIEWFKRAGVAFKNANGELKDSGILFSEISDAVKKLTDAGQKAKASDLSKGIFGEGIKEARPLLEMGSAGLAAAAAEGRASGDFFSKEDIENAKEFNKSLFGVKNMIMGLGFTIGKELMPVVGDVLKNFRGWIKENRGLVSSKIKEWVSDFAEKLPALIQGFQDATTSIRNFFARVNKVIDSIGGWTTILKGFAIFIGVKLVVAIAALTKAFAALGLALLTNPIILIGTAIVAAGYAIYRGVKWIIENWDMIKAATKEAWESIKGFFSKGWEYLKADAIAGWNKLAGFFKGLIEGAKKIGKDFMEGLWQGLKEKWESVKAWFSDIGSSVKNFFSFGDSGISEDVRKNSFSAVQNAVSALPAAPSGKPAVFAPKANLPTSAAEAKARTNSSVHREEKIEKSTVRLELPRDVKATGVVGPGIEIVNVGMQGAW